MNFMIELDQYYYFFKKLIGLHLLSSCPLTETASSLFLLLKFFTYMFTYISL